MNRSVFILAACTALIARPIRSTAAEGSAADVFATRAAFLDLIDRPRVPLAPEVGPAASKDGLVQFEFSYATESGQRVPGTLIEPSRSTYRRATVIGLHGTGATKDEMLPIMTDLARAGFIAVAIDGRYHGMRSADGKGTRDYEKAILRTYRTGREHPLFYDTVWDTMRLIDYLETRPDVDARRIGLTGISKGGIETYLTAAVDRRVAVAVPFVGMQSFRWGLDHDAWQARIATFQPAFDGAASDAGIARPTAAFARIFYDRVAPGIYGQFDGPSMIRLIAPRPLLLINADLDRNCPLPGVEECAESARQAYGAADAGRFVLTVEPHTGHHVNPPYYTAGEKWLARWLKPMEAPSEEHRLTQGVFGRQ